MTGIIIGLAALALIMVNQLRARPMDGGLALPIVLGVIGLLEFGVLFEGGDVAQFKEILEGQHPFVIPGNSGVLIIALGGSLILAAIGAAVRVPTFRVWWHYGQVWRKGTILTAVLWVASLLAHLGYDAWVARDSALAQLGSVTLLLYFAVTLGIQRALLTIRTARVRRTHAATGTMSA